MRRRSRSLFAPGGRRAFEVEAQQGDFLDESARFLLEARDLDAELDAHDEQHDHRNGEEEVARRLNADRGGKLLHCSGAVSYTHLRAHETRHDLVCRLLLEKKKKK